MLLLKFAYSCSMLQRSPLMGVSSWQHYLCCDDDFLPLRKEDSIDFLKSFYSFNYPTQPELSNIINIDCRYLLPHWICPDKTRIYVILLWHSLYQLAAAHACYLGDWRRKVSSICASDVHHSLACARVNPWRCTQSAGSLFKYARHRGDTSQRTSAMASGCMESVNCKQESAVPRRDAARTAAAECCLHADRSSLPFQIESTRSAKLQIFSHHMVDARHIQTAGNSM